MPELISTWQSSGGVQGDNFSFVDSLQGESALVQATVAAGGMVMDVDFRDHNIAVATDNTLPSKVAENNNKPVVDSTPGTATLTVDMYAKFKQFSRQMEATTSPANLVSQILGAVAGQYPIAFDVEQLADIVGGASSTDVEYDAADPVTSLSSLLAPYDTTSYSADAVILTRAGARKLRYAISATDKVLQAPNGISGLFDLPTFVTKATGTQLGTASAMAIVGPFGAGFVGRALGVSIERMPQATVNSKGPEQNIVNYRTEAAMGYANGIDVGDNGNGFTILIDAS